jgi:hypothetical protein
LSAQYFISNLTKLQLFSEHATAIGLGVQWISQNVRFHFLTYLFLANILEDVIPFLPAQEGILPKWMLLTAVTGLGNCIQAFVGIDTTRKLYNEKSGQGMFPRLSLTQRFY